MRGRGSGRRRQFDLHIVDPTQLQQGAARIGRDAFSLGIGIARQCQTEHHTVVLDPYLLNPLQLQQAATAAGIRERLEGGEGLG